MPENLKIGAFVFGAILVLIALLGGNFKVFGAEVAATISNRFLRFVAFALGATFLVVAMHPPNLGNGSVAPDPTSSSHPQSTTSSLSPQTTQSVPSTVTPSPVPTENSSSCTLTISNTLVSLMSEPERLSRQIAKVRPGEYTSLDHKITSFHGLKEEGWFQIEVEGRRGWIADDTWTIDRKSSSCP
ncbi:MAG: hypothetical protein ACRC8A_07045 [Microcoleaceae cyanobacterium]